MGLFGIRHIIFLIVVVAISTTLSILVAKKYGWNKKVLLIAALVIALAEAIRVFILMDDRGKGNYLAPQYLPFHLCALQIFLMFALYLAKNPKITKFLMAFMYPTCVCGAAIALLIPADDMVSSFDNVISFQFMFSHGVLLFFGLYMFLTKPIKYDLKTFGMALGGLAVGLMLAIYLNTIAGGYFDDSINFFYLSYPPMDGLPILNENNGWYGYIFNLSCLAIVLVCLAYIPVFVQWIRKRNVFDINVDTILCDNMQYEDKSYPNN